MTIPEWFVGAFFGALITGFLAVAALTWAAQKIEKAKKAQEDGK